eukprot:scpid88241/ scgid34405/ Smad nuclear interacting protein 1
MAPGKHRSRSRSPRDKERRRDYRNDRGEDSRSHRRHDGDTHKSSRAPRHHGETDVISSASSSRHRDDHQRSHSKETSRHGRRASPVSSTVQSGESRQERYAPQAAPASHHTATRRDDTRSAAGASHPRHSGHSGGQDRRKSPRPPTTGTGTASEAQSSGGVGGAGGTGSQASRRHDMSNSSTDGTRGGKEAGKEEEEEETAHIEARNFERSGKLVEETNTFRGVVIKYSEPDEARKPQRRWRLYPFKGDQQLEVLYIHRQSAYLIGRDRKVCDIPMHHPSISKQHSALQYRLMPFTRDDGSKGHRVRPYLIDLDSTNGCYINNQRIAPQRYYELKPQDMVKFGFSSREYVVLHEGSKDDTLDDVAEGSPETAASAQS